jgi:YggT family protein
VVYQVYQVIHSVIYLYELLIIVWCVLSFIPTGGGGFMSVLKEAIGNLVMPYLSVFQRMIPPVGAIDFSPVVAILVLGVIERLLAAILL